MSDSLQEWMDSRRRYAQRHAPTGNAEDYGVPRGQFPYFENLASDIHDYDAILTWEPLSYIAEDVQYERTALEFFRSMLEPEDHAFLDRVDAFWRAHPAAFNRFYERSLLPREKLHDRWPTIFPPRGLANHVTLWGKAPMVPKSHWWWFRLET